MAKNYCLNCDLIQPNNVDFCSVCGEQLNPKIKENKNETQMLVSKDQKFSKKYFCSSCGTELSTDNKFCPNCGEQLQSKQSSQDKLEKAKEKVLNTPLKSRTSNSKSHNSKSNFFYFGIVILFLIAFLINPNEDRHKERIKNELKEMIERGSHNIEYISDFIEYFKEKGLRGKYEFKLANLIGAEEGGIYYGNNFRVEIYKFPNESYAKSYKESQVSKYNLIRNGKFILMTFEDPENLGQNPNKLYRILTDSEQIIDLFRRINTGNELEQIDNKINNLVYTENYLLFSLSKIDWFEKGTIIGIGIFGNVYLTSNLENEVKNRGLLQNDKGNHRVD